MRGDYLVKLNGSEFFPNLNRNASFYGTAKSDDGVTWKIHVYADYIKSVDVSNCLLPIKELSKIYNQWWSEVRAKEKK